MSAAALSGPARAEAVAALANMTAAALRSGAGGCGERRAQDHGQVAGTGRRIVYVRQSTLAQVERNKESTARQYTWSRVPASWAGRRARSG